METMQKDDSPDIDIAAIAGILFTAYNYASEQADVRQWVSLPSELHYTRIARENMNEPIALQLSDNFDVSSETIRYKPEAKNNQAFIYFSSY